MKAFTLVELLVTLAIIGLLAALLVPGLSVAKRKANSAECVSNLRQLGVTVRLVADENEGRLPRAVMFAESRSNTRGRLPSIQQFLLPHVRETPEVFKCPTDKAACSSVPGRVTNGTPH